MEFTEALAIVVSLAKAHRVVAPIEGNVNETSMDEALSIVEERLNSLLGSVKPKRRK